MAPIVPSIVLYAMYPVSPTSGFPIFNYANLKANIYIYIYDYIYIYNI